MTIILCQFPFCHRRIQTSCQLSCLEHLFILFLAIYNTLELRTIRRHQFTFWTFPTCVNRQKTQFIGQKSVYSVHHAYTNEITGKHGQLYRVHMPFGLKTTLVQVFQRNANIKNAICFELQCQVTCLRTITHLLYRRSSCLYLPIIIIISESIQEIHNDEIKQLNNEVAQSSMYK